MLKITNKMLDARHIAVSPKCRVLFFEGTIRSSKTVTEIQAFMDHVHLSNEENHLISASDLDAINNNILNGNVGLLKLYPECTMKKDKIGGYYIQVMSYRKDGFLFRRKIKKIFLTGFSDVAKWKKVLGGTLGTILIDEINIANKQFVDECFSRMVSCDNPLLIATLNGDIPTHPIYTDYINHASIIGDAPASIRAEMDRVKKTTGFYYMHWTMKDNPVMTENKIKKAFSIYAPGSYYYKIKLLGERGAPGKLIFLDYMNKDKLIKKLDYRDFTHFGIGVDIGANKAKNSFVLAGFTSDYTRIAYFDKVTFQQCGYKEKTEKLKSFVMSCLAKNLNIEYITVDSAEQNYISDLKAEFRQLGLPDVIASYKATIKERIDAIIVLMARGFIQFNDTPEGLNIYDAYSIAKWAKDKEGQEREDLNEWQNDVMDSCEYVMTKNMRKLLYASKMEEVT